MARGESGIPYISSRYPSTALSFSTLHPAVSTQVSTEGDPGGSVTSICKHHDRLSRNHHVIGNKTVTTRRVGCDNLSVTKLS